jgi:tripartite-type tricarboxylate transporter receptor subunit TctC
MTLTRRRFVSSALLSSAVLGASSKFSVAADFPSRDITMIVPWAAGGGTDALGRTLTKNAKQYIGVNVPVVNRPGGTGVAGHASGRSG